MGRIDEQIKIMGYRIEPQEITAVLDRHPAVKASCVTAHSDDLGEVQLVGYVVAATGMRPRAGELRKFVRNHLPDYMVPSAFVQLANLPLSSHGKLDRAALPAPTTANILDDDSVEAPQSQIEKSLASFLAALLGVARVGREDNFFNLGGHSLMAAQVIAKIREAFGVELSLRCLFDHPTLAELCVEIEGLIHAKLASMSEDEALHLLESSRDGIQV
jgi:acyl carrier protein